MTIALNVTVPQMDSMVVYFNKLCIFELMPDQSNLTNRLLAVVHPRDYPYHKENAVYKIDLSNNYFKKERYHNKRTIRDSWNTINSDQNPIESHGYVALTRPPWLIQYSSSSQLNQTEYQPLTANNFKVVKLPSSTVFVKLKIKIHCDRQQNSNSVYSAENVLHS